MKRTKAKVIGAPFLQLYEPTDNINNINAAEDLLYGILCNQTMTKSVMKLGKNQATNILNRGHNVNLWLKKNLDFMNKLA